MTRQDPVERAAAIARDDVDLHDVTEWEPRSALDYVAVVGYRDVPRWLVVLPAAAILAVLFLVTGLEMVADPAVAVLVVLSVIPALAIAAYLWRSDVTTGEPLGVLAITFLLTVLVAGFAAVVNTIGGMVIHVGVVGSLGTSAASAFLAALLLYYVVVGPVEETVKLLAVRLYAYNHERFGAVVDGAIYGAVAGLGFAAIENAIYITDVLGTVPNDALTAAGITGVRALAGPGHVLYSAIAGYYLGLAKFNPGLRGPIVLKGLLVASLFHATYNTLAGIAPDAIAAAAGVGWFTGFLAFVIGYNALVGYYLYRKLERYRRIYRRLGAGGSDTNPQPELTEFDPGSRKGSDE